MAVAEGFPQTTTPYVPPLTVAPNRVSCHQCVVCPTAGGILQCPWNLDRCKTTLKASSTGYLSTGRTCANATEVTGYNSKTPAYNLICQGSSCNTIDECVLYNMAVANGFPPATGAQCPTPTPPPPPKVTCHVCQNCDFADPGDIQQCSDNPLGCKQILVSSLNGRYTINRACGLSREQKAGCWAADDGISFTCLCKGTECNGDTATAIHTNAISQGFVLPTTTQRTIPSTTSITTSTTTTAIAIVSTTPPGNLAQVPQLVRRAVNITFLSWGLHCPPHLAVKASWTRHSMTEFGFSPNMLGV
ncbi:hypothetical protein RvY_19027-2 [Ramazzottius varieornatus]|uniref:Uncharacterized protein n=1 Tax=Ramazzottius varieornatus TaxID=947166 RepID=A0A1D1W7Y5_RAMVA|nr:hypothetical protein RvY_19027-2 [Ramazzottius varieornatus]